MITMVWGKPSLFLNYGLGLIMCSCSTNGRASLVIFFNRETEAEEEAVGAEVASSFHNVIPLWNKLPERIVSCQSSKGLKHHLKLNLFTNH